MLFGFLIVLTEGTAVAPFIYQYFNEIFKKNLQRSGNIFSKILRMKSQETLLNFII